LGEAVTPRQVRLAHVPLGQAVVAEEHVVGARLVENRAPLGGECADEGGVVVEGLDRRERGRHPQPGGHAPRLLERRAGRRRRVLRVEGKEHDAVRAAVPQSSHRRLDGWVLIAHPQLDGPVVSQTLLHEAREVLAMKEQRRAAIGPDLAVGLGALGRSQGQDDQVEQQRPTNGVDVEDPRVGEELPQIAAHLGSAWRIRRPEIDEQEAVLRRRARVRRGHGGLSGRHERAYRSQSAARGGARL
jgi:hypothetical protein